MHGSVLWLCVLHGPRAAWDGMAWHEMGWDGMAWDGMAWHDIQIVAGLKHIVDNMFSFNFGMLHARFACSIVHFHFGLGGNNFLVLHQIVNLHINP